MKLQAQDKELIRLALKEDLSRGDPTTEILIQKGGKAEALIFARSNGIISGLNIARVIFDTLDPKVKFEILVTEGSKVKANTPIARVKGKIEALFKGERTALNFIQHLSGISSFTHQFVNRVKKGSVQITDTRKTSPGLRTLEKYAVRMGGGINHRMTLGDFILIKDNHWKFFSESSLPEKVRKIRKKIPRMKIEVEVKKTPELKKALEANVDIVMLDNMSYENLKKAVRLIKNWRKKKRKPIIEISGGVNLENIGRLSRLGVERISIGALTHSAPGFSVNMEMING